MNQSLASPHMELVREFLPLPDDDDETRRLKLTQARIRVKELRLCLSSLWHWNTRVLGNDPAKVRVLQDPKVREFIDLQGAHLFQWLTDRAHDKALAPNDTTPRRVPTRRKAMLLVPRRTGKTTNVSECIPSYVHAHDPDISVGICAATKDLTGNFASATRQHWKGERKGSRLVEMFGQYYPGQGNSDRPWNEAKVVTLARRDLTRHDPTLMTFSVATGATGGHPDIVVMDDPITEEKLVDGREAWMRKAYSAYKSLGMVLNPDGYFLLVATRYGDDDLVGQIIRTEIEPVVRDRVLPGCPKGELPDDFKDLWYKYAYLAGWHVINRACEFDPDGEPVPTYFPVAWTPDQIAEEKLKDPMWAACQLNNRPGDFEGNPIKQAHIDQIKIDRSQVPPEAYSYLTLHGDWAFKDPDVQDTARGDWNTLFACAHWQGNVYVVKGWHSRTASMVEAGQKVCEFVDWAWNVAKFPGDPAKKRFKQFTFDKDTGQQGAAQPTQHYFENQLRQAGLPNANIDPIHRAKGKNNKARMYSVTGYWQEPRIFIVNGVEGGDEACAEMLTIASCAFDDHASALADAFGSAYRPQARRSTNSPTQEMESLVMTSVANEQAGINPTTLGLDDDDTPVGPYPWRNTGARAKPISVETTTSNASLSSFLRMKGQQ